MKKVFLSLATIAFVAAGSLTVTSCGGDDSTTPNPGPTPPPVETAGKFSWAGKDYPMDTTTTGVVINAQNQMIAYNIGTEEAPVLATRWIVISHEGEGTEWQTSENALWTQVFVPVDGTTAVYPHESEELFLLATEVMIGGESVADPEGITAFNMNIAVWDEDGEKINYTTSTTFAEGTVNLSFNGMMNGPLGFTLSSGKSNGSSLKSIKSTQLANETVDFNNVQTTNNAKLVKIISK